jgi:phosphohistidine phosphatase
VYTSSVRLYLVRHGEAVSEEDAGSDRDRWLVTRGREQVRVLARVMREHGVTPDAIVCSPLPRAVQTAELLAGALDYLGTIASWRCLEPSAQPQVAARRLVDAGEAVVVVGHEPSISALGAHLLARPSFPPFLARGDLGYAQAYFID